MMLARLLLVICVIMAGCTTQNSGGEFAGGILGPNSSVAVQALGLGAYSIDPTYGYNIRTPGIYTFHKDGSAYEICQKDVREQVAIKGMKTEVINHADDNLEDNLAITNLTVSVPGIGTFNAPYKKIKIEGYTVTTLISGNSGESANYVLANVAPSCRNTVLNKNKPYMIVTQIATAKTAYSLSKGTYQAALSAGANVSWANPEVKSPARHNVTFALKGAYVSK